MRTIGLRSQSDREFSCPAGKIGFLVITAVYAALGDKDKAFEWLDKDFQARNGKLVEVRWQLQSEALRDDPRYKDLLRRINLPE
jgi:hypothetical protein